MRSLMCLLALLLLVTACGPRSAEEVQADTSSDGGLQELCRPAGNILELDGGLRGCPEDAGH